VETGSERGTEPENEPEDASESDDQDAPVHRRTGLVLSGNPNEEAGTNNEFGDLDGLPEPVPSRAGSREDDDEAEQEILSNDPEPAHGQLSGSGSNQSLPALVTDDEQ